jgi:hypothetical protein
LGASKERGASAALRAARLLLLVALLAAGIWCLPRVAPLAEQRRLAFLVDPVHVATAAAPEWFRGPIEESLRGALEALSPAPLRSDEEVEALVRSLCRASGWMRAIERVEKRYPNRLEVELALRRPIALLESEQGLVVADEEGVVVAPAAEAAAYLARHEVALVHGPRPLRAAAPGSRLEDAWLEEGLRVAAELLPHRGALAERGILVDVIDVTAQQRQGGVALADVELYTRDGLAIEWGRSSGHPRFGALEPAPDAKVRALLRVAARHPELAGIRRIRLQFRDPYVVLEEPHPPRAAPPTSP